MAKKQRCGARRKQPRLNRNFMHKCPIRGIVLGSPAAAVLTPTVRSRTENPAHWVSVELVWEGKRNFDELIKTL